jgi:hypothetical protein
MSIHDDEQFEKYLKEFRPLTPAALPSEKKRGKNAKSGTAPRMVALVAAAATMLGVVVFTFSLRLDQGSTSRTVARTDGTERLLNPQPLTIRSANALLLSAPSFEAAVNEMVFPSQATLLPKDKHSAITVLSKQRTKL